MIDDYIETFFSRYSSSVRCNGRLGFIGIFNDELTFAIETRTKRKIYVYYNADTFELEKIRGKKKFTEDDALLIAKKVAEITLDYEKHNAKREEMLHNRQSDPA